MALSKLQAEEVLELFLNNFINEATGVNRKRVFQRFDDIFGSGIANWKKLTLDIMNERGFENAVINEFNSLIDGNKKDLDYEYRELCENDFIMVRELLNRGFDESKYVPMSKWG